MIRSGGGDEAMGNYPAHMTAAQVADYLNIQVKTIRKWTSEGRIPHSKLGSMVRGETIIPDQEYHALTFNSISIR